MKETFEIPLKTQFETERLKSLAEYQIMDTLHEREYDAITELASYICRTPVSLITFIDVQRQWFKSAVGTDLTENTRLDSFCTHTLMHPRAITMVPEAKKDLRFVQNPVVVNDPGIDFYAGVPLLSRENQPIGTLCVMDVKPNMLDEHQQKALKTLADQVSKLLELRRTNMETLRAAAANEVLLQQKIAERVGQLKEQNVKLSRAHREIERMIHVASHDLKEPVRKLKMYTGLMSDNSDKPEQFTYFLEKVHECADRVGDLISDISDFSETNVAEVAFEAVDLTALIDNIRAENQPLINEKAATLSYKELPIVRGNAHQLKQLFTHLLQNSLKYSSEEPRVSIQVTTVQKKLPMPTKFATYYRIDFSDNGIGFEPKYRAKIFDFFQRLHTRRVFEGNGIGLTIVKQVALNHGGWVSASSTPGEGAIFSVFLPQE